MEGGCESSEDAAVLVIPTALQSARNVASLKMNTLMKRRGFYSEFLHQLNIY
jgi:hypothetical protein